MSKVVFKLMDNRIRVHTLIDQAPNGYVVEIKQYSRTHEQNALYWATVHSIAEQVFLNGKKYAPEVWHIYFKQRFLNGDILELPNGQLIQSEPSTTELSTEEFSNFVNNVIQFYDESI